VIPVISRVPDMGYMYPKGYICPSGRPHLLYSRNKLTLRHKKGVYFYSSKNLIRSTKMQWIFVISITLVIRTFRGTFSSVKKLKKYMARERLETAS